MWKKSLAVLTAAVLLIGSVPVTSYAASYGETEKKTENVGMQEQGVAETQTSGETQTEEETQPEKETLSQKHTEEAAEDTSDVVVRENPDTVSGNEVLPELPEPIVEEDSSLYMDADAAAAETVETVEEMSETETEGTLRPYEGAAYSLTYRVNDSGDGITITGITDYESKESGLGKLVIPEEVEGLTVTEISYGAFQGCSGFSGKLVLPAGLTEIGWDAFKDCSGFTGDLVIPIGVTEISYGAFRGCSGFDGALVLPEGLVEIGAYAFDFCWRFSGNLVIPEEVKKIDNFAFFACNFSGELLLPEGLEIIGENAFKDCSRFTGDLVIPEGVKEIGKGAFSGCSRFTGGLIISAGVTTIGESAFEQCRFNGRLLLPEGLEIIGRYAFYNCRDFTGDLVIPDGVATIGEMAFYNCSGFTGKLVIPDGVTTIGEGAFYNCSGLTGKLVIPDGVTTIGDNAFSNCSGLTELPIYKTKCSLAYYIENGRAVVTGIKNYKSLDDLGELVIPETIEGVSVVAIDKNAFYGQSGFSGKLIIPAGVKEIGEFAFYNCSGFSGDLVLPEGLETIGENAFTGCSGFNGNLLLPEGLTEIGWGAFADCNGFTGNLVIPAGVATIGGRAFYNCSGFTGKLVIPDGVTTIGGRAFYNCSGFTGKLVIPDGVTTIGDNAFSNCSGLTELPIYKTKCSLAYYIENGRAVVTGIKNYKSLDDLGELVIPEIIEGAPVAEIKSNAFSDYSFDGVTISAANVSRYAFSNCNMGTLTLQKEVVSLEPYAIYGSTIKDLIVGMKDIPDKMAQRYSGMDGVFQNCSFIGNLILKEGVSTIGHNAFSDRYDFSGELVLPAGVNIIGDGAFENCTGFTNVTIPDTTQKIGESAFAGGQGPLRKITVLGKKTSIASGGLGERCFVRGYLGSTAEEYTMQGYRGCTFVALDAVPEITEYRVSTTAELKDAIGSYRHIIVADGIYETSTAIDLSYLTAFTLEAEHPGKVEILSRDGDSPVIRIKQCTDMRIAGCILGHQSLVEADTSGCGFYDEGYVVSATTSYDVDIEYCDLYGCGITGIYCVACENINLSDCLIRDCMRDIMEGGADGLNIRNCIISGNAYAIDKYATKYAALSCGGKILLENCVFLNNYSTSFKKESCQVDIVNCSFYDNAWDGKTPKAYGVCLNGITWQVVGDTLKIGYPLQLDKDTVIQSKKGDVLSYSDSSLPWKQYKDLKMDIAPEVQNGQTDEEAAYSLTYTVRNDEVIITGIADYNPDASNLGQLVIPDKINGLTVTEIDWNAFWGCSGFDGELVLPEGLRRIGSHAFFGCSGFRGELVLPEELTEISFGAFQGCSGFTGDLVIPDGVTEIEGDVFYGCDGFNGNLIIPAGVIKIGSLAFGQCRGFTGELVLPEGLEEIDESAFWDCSGFSGGLVIPAGVTKIGAGAFRGRSSLTSVTVLGKETSIDARGTYWENGEYVERGVFGPINLICGYPGSTAEAYAETNNCTFIPLTETAAQNAVEFTSSVPDTDVTVPMQEGAKLSLLSSVLADKGLSDTAEETALEITVSETELQGADRQTVDSLVTSRGMTAVQCLDISMKLRVGSEKQEVTRTPMPVRFVVDIPRELRQEDRRFSVVRLHDGQTQILQDLDNSPDTVTIETDCFSSYTLVYWDGSGAGSLTGTAVFFPGSGDGNTETVLVLKDADGVEAARTTVAGAPDSENKKLAGTYCLDGFAAGIYTLQASRDGHTTREYTVTITLDGADTSGGAGMSAVQDVELWLGGDVSGDGKITALDKKLLFNHMAGTTPLAGYALSVGDVSGDGKITALDKKLLFNHMAGTTPLW